MANTFIDGTSTTWESEVLQAEGLVMIIFWAEWCEPCLKFFSTVEEIAIEYTEKLKVVRLNVDDNEDIASMYRVSILPTIMFFKHRQKLHEIITAVPKTEIEAAIISL